MASATPKMRCRLFARVEICRRSQAPALDFDGAFYESVVSESRLDNFEHDQIFRHRCGLVSNNSDWLFDSNVVGKNHSRLCTVV
jgi:hypothetical protein